MLSGLEILKQIENGNIVISNFEIERLNPNSYNIKLGKNLKFYKNADITPDDIKEEVREAHPEIKEMYMTLCNALKDESITSDELQEHTQELQDFYNKLKEYEDDTLKKYALDPRKENETIDVEIPEEGYVLLPGILYLGETEEYTETYGFVPKIDGRSTTGRLGIEIHRTAGFGDNGFKGKWTLEITVTHPVIVYPGMEIGQLYYETIDGDTSMQYNGKYQNQEGVQAAKIDARLLEDDLK